MAAGESPGEIEPVIRMRFIVGAMCLLAEFFGGRAEVRILSPTNGTVYPAYSTVRIEVEPTFAEGESAVSYGVERDFYYPDGNLIAEMRTPPYSLTLSNVPAGLHK